MNRHKLFLFLILLSVFLIQNAYSDTIISGGDITDGQWTVGGSPYIVNGNISLPQGSTLTIEKGVTVLFGNDIYMTVRGTLVSEGTVNEPVVMRPSGSFKWNGLRLQGSLCNSSVIEYTDISGAEAGLTVSYSSPKINHCWISENQTGILLAGGSSDLTIQNCRIERNETSGISFYQHPDHPITYTSEITIKNNIICRNQTGISFSFVTNTLKTSLLNNTISYNLSSGVSLGSYGRSLPANIIGNNIVGNQMGLNIFRDGTRSFNNVWGNHSDYNPYFGPSDTDISQDPLFSDIIQNNYTLQADSPCIDATSDLNDIGAYGDGGSPPTNNDAWYEQITTSGELDVNEIWSGDILITDTVTIPHNHSLKIRKGTNIKFIQDTGLIIKGIMISEGDSENPVQMTSNSEELWAGMSFQYSICNNSKINYITVTNATTGIYCAVSRPIIKNCLFEDNNYGIGLSNT